MVSHIAVYFPVPSPFPRHVSCYHVSTCSSFARWISMERAADIKLKNTREMSKIRMYSREVHMINTEKRYIYHLEKRISEGKRGKKGNGVDSFSIARNNGIARNSKKKKFSLYFYSSRVCRMTPSVKISRYSPSRFCTCGKKWYLLAPNRTDYWLTTVEIMFRRSCLEFDSEETASLVLPLHVRNRSIDNCNVLRIDSTTCCCKRPFNPRVHLTLFF